MRTFVIAEAGICHDGDLNVALNMIDNAKAAGADACKFQTFNAKKLCQRRGKPELDLILKPYEMPLSWLPILKGHCDEMGIEFMTTCFDEETLKEAAPLLKRFKIGHGEIGDQQLLDACESYGKPIIRSIPEGPRVARPKGRTLEMYVTTKYPTPPAEVYLEVIRNYFDGFSDHTKMVAMGSWAVAAGAAIVEVHFHGWDTDKANLDMPVSHDPVMLARYILFIRQAELAVYGVETEESRTPERPESAPHTSHLPVLGNYDLPDAPQAGGC